MSPIPLARFWKALGVIALVLGGMTRTEAQMVPPDSSIRSHSGQFVAYPAPYTLERSRPPTGETIISLEPALLVISCERVRQTLCRELDANTPWQGRIYLYLYHAKSANDPITIVADRANKGWRYRVELPDNLEQARFLRGIVQVLLLELANRNAADRSAEIPLWMSEGFAQELRLSHVELLLPPPRTSENGLNITYMMANSRRTNLLAQAQQVLRERAPLTFEQLSWPPQDSGEPGDVYASSAHLFVNQLLRMNGGPACFRGMLDDLPSRRNWQFAFLNGFQPHFGSMLEVEKWWALQLVQFAERDLLQLWTQEASWNKLDEIVRSRVEVRSNSSELPLRTQVNLQTMIREWDTAQQTQVLQRKLQELHMLRVHVSQDLVVLVDDYRQVIGIYLQRRNAGGGLPFFKPAPTRIADETIRQLDILDLQRETLRPTAPTAPVAAAGVTEKAAITP